MSVVKINAIHVPEGAGAELEARFAARKHSVDGADGFEGFQLLRPVAGDARYFVVTTWRDEEAFRAWSEDGAKAAHAGPPAGGAGAAASAGPPAGGAGAAASAGHADASRPAAHADGPRGGEEQTPRGPVATGADLLEFEVVEL